LARDRAFPWTGSRARAERAAHALQAGRAGPPAPAHSPDPSPRGGSTCRSRDRSPSCRMPRAGRRDIVALMRAARTACFACRELSTIVFSTTRSSAPMSCTLAPKKPLTMLLACFAAALAAAVEGMKPLALGAACASAALAAGTSALSNVSAIGRMLARIAASTSSCGAPRTLTSFTRTSASPTRSAAASAWPPGTTCTTTLDVESARPSGPAANVPTTSVAILAKALEGTCRSRKCLLRGPLLVFVPSSYIYNLYLYYMHTRCASLGARAVRGTVLTGPGLRPLASRVGLSLRGERR